MIGIILLDVGMTLIQTSWWYACQHCGALYLWFEDVLEPDLLPGRWPSSCLYSVILCVHKAMPTLR